MCQSLVTNYQLLDTQKEDRKVLLILNPYLARKLYQKNSTDWKPVETKDSSPEKYQSGVMYSKYILKTKWNIDNVENVEELDRLTYKSRSTSKFGALLSATLGGEEMYKKYTVMTNFPHKVCIRSCSVHPKYNYMKYDSEETVRQILHHDRETMWRNYFISWYLSQTEDSRTYENWKKCWFDHLNTESMLSILWPTIRKIADVSKWLFDPYETPTNENILLPFPYFDTKTRTFETSCKSFYDAETEKVEDSEYMPGTLISMHEISSQDSQQPIQSIRYTVWCGNKLTQQIIMNPRAIFVLDFSGGGTAEKNTLCVPGRFHLQIPTKEWIHWKLKNSTTSQPGFQRMQVDHRLEPVPQNSRVSSQTRYDGPQLWWTPDSADIVMTQAFLKLRTYLNINPGAGECKGLRCQTALSKHETELLKENIFPEITADELKKNNLVIGSTQIREGDMGYYVCLKKMDEARCVRYLYYVNSTHEYTKIISRYVTSQRQSSSLFSNDKQRLEQIKELVKTNHGIDESENQTQYDIFVVGTLFLQGLTSKEKGIRTGTLSSAYFTYKVEGGKRVTSKIVKNNAMFPFLMDADGSFDDTPMKDIMFDAWHKNPPTEDTWTPLVLGICRPRITLPLTLWNPFSWVWSLIKFACTKLSMFFTLDTSFNLYYGLWKLFKMFTVILYIPDIMTFIYSLPQILLQFPKLKHLRNLCQNLLNHTQSPVSMTYLYCLLNSLYSIKNTSYLGWEGVYTPAQIFYHVASFCHYLAIYGCAHPQEKDKCHHDIGIVITTYLNTNKLKPTVWLEQSGGRVSVKNKFEGKTGRFFSLHCSQYKSLIDNASDMMKSALEGTYLDGCEWWGPDRSNFRVGPCDSVSVPWPTGITPPGSADDNRVMAVGAVVSAVQNRSLGSERDLDASNPQFSCNDIYRTDYTSCWMTPLPSQMCRIHRYSGRLLTAGESTPPHHDTVAMTAAECAVYKVSKSKAETGAARKLFQQSYRDDDDLLKTFAAFADEVRPSAPPPPVAKGVPLDMSQMCSEIYEHLGSLKDPKKSTIHADILMEKYKTQEDFLFKILKSAYTNERSKTDETATASLMLYMYVHRRKPEKVHFNIMDDDEYRVTLDLEQGVATCVNIDGDNESEIHALRIKQEYIIHLNKKLGLITQTQHAKPSDDLMGMLNTDGKSIQFSLNIRNKDDETQEEEFSLNIINKDDETQEEEWSFIGFSCDQSLMKWLLLKEYDLPMGNIVSIKKFVNTEFSEKNKPGYPSMKRTEVGKEEKPNLYENDSVKRYINYVVSIFETVFGHT